MKHENEGLDFRSSMLTSTKPRPPSFLCSFSNTYSVTSYGEIHNFSFFRKYTIYGQTTQIIGIILTYKLWTTHRNIFFLQFCADLALVENVEVHGNGRFPVEMVVFLRYQGNDIQLHLERDDETTALLSEDIFDTSPILPSGLFREEIREVSEADEV